MIVNLGADIIKIWNKKKFFVLNESLILTHWTMAYFNEHLKARQGSPAPSHPSPSHLTLRSSWQNIPSRPGTAEASSSPLGSLGGWHPFPLSFVSGFICKVVRRYWCFLIRLLRGVFFSASAAGGASPWGGVLSYKRTMQTCTGDAMPMRVCVQTHSTGRSPAEAPLLSWSIPPRGSAIPQEPRSSFISQSPKAVNGNSVLKNGGWNSWRKCVMLSNLTRDVRFISSLSAAQVPAIVCAINPVKLSEK